ncbi:MAG TPA: hypothetical protein VMG31_00290 [Verrucomicrobiae bacterium]|nr:hypothetical protein [Verrucomicrobiae bacterium]
MIDQIRASKLPSNMMQFAARGALQVPAAENIEILVYLATNNKIFGELARMTLAGWDEKACLASASDPQTPRDVLVYFISHDNLRPKLLPALLENLSVPESEIVKLATSALRDIVEIMLTSKRVCSSSAIVRALKGNPYAKAEEIAGLVRAAGPPAAASAPSQDSGAPTAARTEVPPDSGEALGAEHEDNGGPEHDEVVDSYLKEHGAEIAAEGDKRFQSIGGALELLGEDFFPITQSAEESPADSPAEPAANATSTATAKPAALIPKKPAEPDGKRQNTLQKINSLDVKGRIQLALKGNKEERSILIRDGTKVVALAVLEAPKLADGEVEKFASQKNVLEAVLRQIPLKRRFMKNYIVVRNLVANPRTPIDLSLGLMKNLLTQDLKNLSNNKEVSETIRKLALKMYKQKLESANKK